MRKIRKINIGEIFGRLTVVKPFGKKGDYLTWWCKCECGVEKEIVGVALKKGNVKSCGCLLSEMSRNRQLTHGLSRTTEHNIWVGMIKRCYNISNINYCNYGGRGITVCDRWMEKGKGVSNFVFDMGMRPSNLYTLDRIDNNGNYEPSNCRWATRATQKRNTSYNLWYEYNGIRMVVTDWELLWGIHKNSIQTQLKRGKTFSQVYDFYENKKANQ